MPRAPTPTIAAFSLVAAVGFNTVSDGRIATEAIAKLDKRNASRSSKPSKTAIANEPIKVSIMEYVTAHANALASDIAVACEISTQKASALCVQMVKDEVLTVCEVKVPKKGKINAYSLAVADEGADE